jgi:hypothetical protein
MGPQIAKNLTQKIINLQVGTFAECPQIQQI